MANLKVRARAVDMLGRQQIAGIPTAIHELLKNAHDAYAERAEIDFFRQNNTLILRDDGYGMTREDVENRWLTLGTESRYSANKSENHWTGPRNVPQRSIMGEKGIGRLAIAVIAPITLLMTRAIRPDSGIHDLVVVLVHWGLFEQPGLDIGQINIPIQEFADGMMPTSADVKKLFEKIEANLDTLKDDLLPNVYKELKKEVSTISFAPDQLDRFLNKELTDPLSLTNGGFGTQFIMLPTKPELIDDIESGKDGESSTLEKSLLGFSNTMSGDDPLIKIAFRDHELDGSIDERISERLFFEADDFRMSDHNVEGQIDEFGQFRGKISIYKQQPIEFVCNWPEGKGHLTKCGPFSIKFAYLMGEAKESLLEPDDHKIMYAKLSRVGGLYIYKDGIRILPYGSADYDFLEIEKRRTKSAQDWFFSYRRLIGFVAISNNSNAGLNEKAGREGFRQNIAYREFRAVLMNLFQRLALEFFRPTSPQSEYYWDIKNEFDAAFQALKRQKKKADERRQDFAGILKKFFDKYEEHIFQELAKKLQNETKEKISVLAKVKDKAQLSTELEKLTSNMQKSLRTLENEITIQKPRGLALRGQIEKDWNAYSRISAELKTNLIDKVRANIFNEIVNLQRKNIDPSRVREMSIAALSTEGNTLVKELSGLRQEAYEATEQMQSVLRNIIKAEFSEFRSSVETLISDFTVSSAKNPDNIEILRSEIERRFIELKNQDAALFESIRRNMDDLAEDLKEGLTSDDRVGALEQEVISLEEKLEFYNDFAQVGMSVGILQHEFEKSAHDLRRAMRDLKPWADGTPELNVIYKQVRNSFDHLDGYLNLLDPLGRRMNRRKSKISGDAIRVHLIRIFGRRLEDESITLETTGEFVAKSVKCHSSALLGAFVNILDNAIYWVANGAQDKKVIKLSSDNRGFLISNSGPGIEARYKDRIFEFGESMKPKGRGMGLFISKDTLLKEGFDLELIQWGRDNDPIFRIITDLGEENNEH